jgi:ABC-type sugar transport system, periplasmic component
MKKSTRKALCKPLAAGLILSMLAGSLFTGCQSSSAGSAANNSSAASGDPNQPVTITLMQQNTPDKVYFKTIAQDFMDLHKNVTINIIQVPYDQFDSKLQTMIAAHTQPDITTNVQSMGFKDFYAKGLLTDLTPYIQKYEFDAAKVGIPENVMEMSTVDNKIYGIPLNTFTTVLMYNKDLFDKAGVAYPPSSYEDKTWTFDKMVEDAKKLTSGSDANATYGLIWDWASGIQSMNYFGKGLLPDEAVKTGYCTKSNFNDPEVVKNLQRFADLALIDKVQPTPDIQSAMSGSNGTDPFMTGKVAMEVEGAWGLSGVNDLPFKVGVAAIPVGGNDKIRSVMYNDPYFILQGCKNPDIAFQFIQFMAQTDEQIKMVQLSSGDPPANVHALSSYYSFFKSVDPKDMQAAVEGSLGYSEECEEHAVVGSGQIDNLYTNEMNVILNGSKKAQDACPQIAEKMDKVLQDINAAKK